MNARFGILFLTMVLSFGGNVWAQYEMHDSHHGKDAVEHEHGGDEKSHEHSEEQGEKAVYTCPMHPEVKQDQPGQCPKCGMNLEKVEAREEAQEIKGEMKEETPEHSGMEGMADHDMHGTSGHKH